MKITIITPCAYPSFQLGGPVKSTLELGLQIKKINKKNDINIISWMHDYSKNDIFYYKNIKFIKLNGLKTGAKYFSIGIYSIFRLIKIIIHSDLVILNLGFDPLITISGFLSTFFSKSLIFFSKRESCERKGYL